MIMDKKKYESDYQLGPCHECGTMMWEETPADRERFFEQAGGDRG